MTKTGRGVWSLAVAILAYLSWLAFAGTLSSHELLLGCACAISSAAACLLTWHAMGLAARGPLSDFLTGWRVPWNILTDGWIIVRILILDLLGIRRADSLFRVCPFATSNSPRDKMRRVLAVAYCTATPNSIVIGIDTDQKKMIYHQLVPDGVPPIARALGAKE